MQRYLLLIAAATALVAAGFWCFAQFGTVPPGSSQDNPAIPPSATDPKTGRAAGAADPATQTAHRIPVEVPAGGASATRGTHVLRVILEEIPEERARKATVTVTAYDKAKETVANVGNSWPSQASTSEFDLDPYLAVVAERLADLNVDELKVEVEHPEYLRETTRVPVSHGVKRGGQTVYEVRVRLVRPEYWPEFSLAVRDARTREHLEDIELRSSPGAGMASWGRNSVRTLLGDGLTSPITLMGGRDADEAEAAVAHLALRPAAGESPRLVRLGHYMRPGHGVILSARAPGYAWGSIVLDLSKSDGRELLLRPGAALDLRLANVQLERYRALETEPMLCVYWIRKDGGNQFVRFEPLDETLATEGLRLPGLPPGGYRVTVELGGGTWTKKPVLAREELSGERVLVAGETRRMLLALADPPAPPERATLAGVVSLPAGGSEKKVRLQLYFQPTQRWRDPDVEFSLAELQRTSGALPSWSFRAEDLPVGMYRVQLLPFLKVWMIELPAGGREDLQLVLPELAEVLVETVDGRTGERVPLDEFHYRREKPLPGQAQRDRARADTEEPGRFRFWTAPGAVSIWPRGQGRHGYGRAWKDLELVPGRQSVRFELAPFCRIRFEFRVDGGAPRLSDGIAGWVRYGTFEGIRAVDHEGRSLGRAGERVAEVSAPGAYRIDFEGLTKGRFHPIPPRIATVRAGETAEVIVELRRK